MPLSEEKRRKLTTRFERAEHFSDQTRGLVQMGLVVEAGQAGAKMPDFIALARATNDVARQNGYPIGSSARSVKSVRKLG